MTQPAPPANLTSALEIAEALRPVLHRLLRELRRESQHPDVSPLQALLLASIVKHPGIGVTDLAALENVRGPTISGHIKAMESAGLVGREANDPDDRRRVGLVATKKGRDAIKAIKRNRTDWLAHQLAALSPADRRAIREAIEPLGRIVA
ncbi:MarR family winged helix-turn-helix transcriptional regulator [Paraburkholderia acidipaludis]|uniref:MarR family winged helix-turn-helix transcriptional regulator n=1 Tax=Paraburkholderia acidipaludis TaxID=660537 RepID=UPI000487BD85|nr:MarR family winged helix-turn-helix transcriptional regulator [Paraburkholderia acidipaludis]